MRASRSAFSSSTSTARSSRLAGASRRLTWLAVWSSTASARATSGVRVRADCRCADDVLLGRCDQRRARNVDDLAHRVHVTRRRHHLVAGLGIDREIVDEIDHVLLEDVVRLDDDAERGSETGLVLEPLDVGDHVAPLVDPLDRVGLDLGPALHEDAADEQEHRGDEQPEACLGGQPAELDHDALHERRPSLLGRLGPLPDPERRRGNDDPDDDQHDDTDREQDSEIADHRDLRESQGHERDDTGDRGDDQRWGEVGERLCDRMRARGRARLPPRLGCGSGSRSRCRARSGSGAPRSSPATGRSRSSRGSRTSRSLRS